MHQKDYILRLIEQAGAVLARVRRLLFGGASAAEVEQAMSEAARLAGVDLRLLRDMTPDTLLLLMSPGGEPEPSRCWITAELLYLEGRAADAAGDEGAAMAAYGKALLLFRALSPDLLPGLPEAEERVRELEALVDAG
ncbi:MAG TPA: hypothetical protein VMK65_13195 [Longimicrobiales bacterium]|nr:hypothetical protein [Longimicrobiales bacterium]